MRGIIATIIVAIAVIALLSVFHFTSFDGGCFNNGGAQQRDC